MLAAFSFLSSGPGKIALLVIAVFAWTAYQRHDAAVGARAKAELQCQADVAAATQRETQRQSKAAEGALRAAAARAVEAEDARNALETRIATVTARLRSAPVSGCRVDDEFLRELQSIQ